MTKQRWITAGAALAALTLIPTAGALAAPTNNDTEGPRVVAEGLNNPRQLSWTDDEETLIVAEAGRGGTDCTDAGCVGLTGAISLIEDPDSEEPNTSVAISGFFSMASPDGSFAVGSNGAVSVDYPDGGYLVAGSDSTKPAMQGGALLGAINVHSDEPFIFTIADLWAAEQEQNPDGAQIESNPYGVLFVDPTTEEEKGEDGYALVADAAANTVWKVEPNYAEPNYGEQPTEMPDVTVSVFASYPTTALPDGSDDPQGPAEFVPTSLATDDDGAIYVGGLGSERPGAASVVKYTAEGEETTRWGGFTSITGIAVDEENLYVSQLFGSVTALLGEEGSEAPVQQTIPGQVIKLDHTQEHSTRWAIDVPLPAGLATDGSSVYASVNSISAAEGTSGPFGPVGPGSVWELDFANAYEVAPTNG